uniref:SMP-LTD domain-containing protein n=1 Tax=Rhizophora mucronata TaxID=61149 RepID=A0A2P2MPT4_RHIMU
MSSEFTSSSSSSSFDFDSSTRDLDPQQSLDFAYHKKGFVWVLESEKVPKHWLLDKAPKESRRKRDLLEVNPVRKYARIKDQTFILSDLDGSNVAVPLKGCTIESVSATDHSSRKWAKRFPIKLDNKNSVVYNGSKTVFIYLKTSWEKESWCKALRFASFDDKERLNWFTKLNGEFHGYLTSLNTGYPSFMKPSVGFNAPLDSMAKLDGSASKVRLFWKKFARKASKTGIENRGTRSLGNGGVATNLIKTTPTAKIPLGQENVALPSSSTFSHAASQCHNSVASDLYSDDKFNIDEGTLCWNLLISRLFFDAKVDLKSSVRTRIQRTLSNMRTPSYIGEVICNDVDLGNLPPYIHSIKVLPMEMNEVWAWEVDIEYCGGLVLNIETRLEVHDQDLQKSIVDTNSESSSVGSVSSDLLEGFEYFGKQLNLSEETTYAQKLDEGEPQLNELENFTSCTPRITYVSRWKTILNSIAKQVSQVPLSLSIRVTSLRGTVRLHIKPPPSDQLWFGFTSMPDIEFNLESSVGEQKISSANIAFFLISRLKTSIRETLVLPNCENVCIPWMLAEKNDWVPWKVAPFIWLNREVASENVTPHDAFSPQPDEATSKIEATGATSTDNAESKHKKVSTSQYSTQAISNPPDASAYSLSSSQPMQSSKSLQELETPLLASTDLQETCGQNRGYIPECQSPSSALIHVEKQNNAFEEDDARPKRIGRRAKMLDLGKKMGEKLEEKRRHIEEKGRNIVEKMRGP